MSNRCKDNEEIQRISQTFSHARVHVAEHASSWCLSQPWYFGCLVGGIDHKDIASQYSSKEARKVLDAFFENLVDLSTKSRYLSFLRYESSRNHKHRRYKNPHIYLFLWLWN